jgi:UDP:flavonoid glycosyltransferase YjiC (YdhE family)
MTRRVLFVSENVTLAQVVRLVTLAESLVDAPYEVHFACSEFPAFIFGQQRFHLHRLATVPAQRVARALETGQRLYDARTLDGYVRAELELMARVRPDVVVGDFRQSLAVSAPVFGVRYAAFINAYWSPWSELRPFPLPEHPIVKLLGQELAAEHFPKALPFVFQHFAAPLNQVRRRYGLPKIGSLLETLTWGNDVLFADVPELVPTRDAPPHHHYLGYVPWAPRLEQSAETERTLSALEADRPSVYVTLGSSGKTGVLPLVLEALAGLDVNVFIATAGRVEVSAVDPRWFVAPYWPGDVMARKCAFVVTNGGSSTGYQALAEGTPVLGLPFNLDQYLAMTAIERFGAGLLVRSGSACVGELRAAMAALLASREIPRRAQEAARSFARYDSRARFRAWLAEVIQAQRPSAASSST